MRLSTLKTFLFALLIIQPLGALADDGRLEIYSAPLTEQQLPEPKRAMELTAELLNIDNTSIPLKALITIDGNLMTALPIKTVLNERDIPEYTFKINAPTSDISYQFIAFPKDAPAVVSKRYTITRSCVTDLSFATAEGQEELETESLLEALIIQASKLDNESNLYSEAITIAERIKKTLGEIEQ